MTKRDDELISGLQIMTPEEVHDITDNTEENISEETTSDEEIENNELEITPVDESLSDDGEENDDLNITPTDTTNDGDSTDDSKPSVMATFIKELMDEGIIKGPEDEEELKGLLENADVDTVKKLMADTIGKNVNEKQDAWKQSLSSEKKKFLEIEDAFNDTNDAIRIAQRLDYLESITPDAIANDASLQENLYYEDLKLKGFSHEDAVEAVQEAKSLDKLKEKATRAIPSIKAHDEKIVEENKVKAEEERQEFAKKNQEVYDNLMKTIDTRESIVDGLKLNKISRDKIKDNMFKTVYQSKDGKNYTSLMYKQMKNTTEFDLLINYYDTLGLFDLDKDGNFKPNLSKLKNIAKTKATSELENVLSRESKEGVGQRTTVTPNKGQSNILDFLERAVGKKNK